MKKFVCAALAATLLGSCGIGCADDAYYTLSQIREQAASGWHETYTDKYGRSLQVDLDIEVFGEETAPVIKACWGEYPDLRLGGMIRFLSFRKRGLNETACLPICMKT